VPIFKLVFLGLSVLDLGPVYATDRQTDIRQSDVRQTSDAHHRLMPRLWERKHNNEERDGESMNLDGFVL